MRLCKPIAPRLPCSVLLLSRNLFLSQMPSPYLLTILDTETTGLKGEVIEIAAILYHSHAGVLGQCSVVLPFDENPAEFINSIPASAGEIAAAGNILCPDLALEYLGSFLHYSDYLVAHNCEFDKARILDTPTLKEIHGYMASKPWIDTCHTFKWPKQTKQGQKLIELALQHGCGVSSAHRAMTDCDMIARMFDLLKPIRRETGNLLDELIEQSQLPRQRYRALVSFDEKDKAKAAGFQWDGKSKSWWMSMTAEDATKADFDFEIRRAA